MGVGAHFFLTGSRIAYPEFASEDPDIRNWVDVEDEPVVDYDNENMIIALAFGTPAKQSYSTTIYIEWRNKTDDTAWVLLTGAGELTWTATTDLEDLTTVVEAETGCTPDAQVTYVDGDEREGGNASKVSLTANDWSEFHYAVNFANAHPGDEYEFRLWDDEEESVIGVCLATVTLAAAVLSDVYYKRLLAGVV